MTKKLFISLLLAIPALAMASKLDMKTLSCNKLKITSSTTVADIQKSCLIKKQTTSSGRFEIEFVNTATQKTVGCYFASKQATALVNSCHSVGIF